MGILVSSRGDYFTLYPYVNRSNLILTLSTQNSILIHITLKLTKLKEMKPTFDNNHYNNVPH